jgi:hypothetical protein
MDNILDVKGLSKHIGKSTWKKNPGAVNPRY